MSIQVSSRPVLRGSSIAELGGAIALCEFVMQDEMQQHGAAIVTAPSIAEPSCDPNLLNSVALLAATAPRTFTFDAVRIALKTLVPEWRFPSTPCLS